MLPQRLGGEGWQTAVQKSLIVDANVWAEQYTIVPYAPSAA